MRRSAISYIWRSKRPALEIASPDGLGYPSPAASVTTSSRSPRASIRSFGAALTASDGMSDVGISTSHSPGSSVCQITRTCSPNCGATGCAATDRLMARRLRAVSRRRRDLCDRLRRQELLRRPRSLRGLPSRIPCSASTRQKCTTSVGSRHQQASCRSPTPAAGQRRSPVASLAPLTTVGVVHQAMANRCGTMCRSTEPGPWGP